MEWIWFIPNQIHSKAVRENAEARFPVIRASVGRIDSSDT